MNSRRAGAMLLAVTAGAAGCEPVFTTIESDERSGTLTGAASECGGASLGGGPTCPVRALATGGYFTCAALAGGAVKCWGESAYGDLGLGDAVDRGGAPGDMGSHLRAVDLGRSRTAATITAGFAHACALLDGGGVKCWGHASVGQLGLGDTVDRGDAPGEMGDALPFVDLGATKPVRALSAGADHTCALFEGGHVKCWGFNYSGQLGLGDDEKRGAAPGQMGEDLPYVDLGPGEEAIAISAGGSHTCALLERGAVKCWGENFNGELGLGDRRDRGDDPGEMGDALPAVDLGEGRSAVQIAAGWDHTCAVLDDGAVKCWGHGDTGQLGLGDLESRGEKPDEMGDALKPVNIGDGLCATRVEAGIGHTCAITTGGVKCWGAGDGGRLGLGDTRSRGAAPGEMGDALPFVDLGTNVRATSLQLGAMHTCAAVGPAGVKCWGENYSGQLGLGDTKDRGDEPGEMGDALPSLDLGPR